MTEDLIRYDILAQDALRGVLRKVLSEVAKTGLPGEHHFYITFDTRVAGVRVSSSLKARFPEELTIVLQHQFWDFKVTDKAFEVSLSFNNVPEHLRIPFAAIKSFFDPSVHFGLQFEPQEDAAGAPAPQAAAPSPVQLSPDPVRPAASPPAAAPARGDKDADKKPVRKAGAQAADKSGEKAGTGTKSKAMAAADAEVISLDSFRKKN